MIKLSEKTAELFNFHFISWLAYHLISAACSGLANMPRTSASPCAALRALNAAWRWALDWAGFPAFSLLTQKTLGGQS
jgi:hypothetical protein